MWVAVQDNRCWKKSLLKRNRTENALPSLLCREKNTLQINSALQACVIFTQHCCYRMSCNASVARLPFLVICYENESASVQSSLSYINVWISAPSAHLSSQVFEKLSCFSSFFCQSSLSVLEYKKKKKKSWKHLMLVCSFFTANQRKRTHTAHRIVLIFSQVHTAMQIHKHICGINKCWVSFLIAICHVFSM